MRFVSVEIENYKSFLKSNPIPFTEGFNVIVGKNNAGKTALVEALSLHALRLGHKSLANKPRLTSRVSTDWSLNAIIRISKKEFDVWLESENAFRIYTSNEDSAHIARNFVKRYSNDRIPNLLVAFTSNTSPIASFDFDGSRNWDRSRNSHQIIFKRDLEGGWEHAALYSLFNERLELKLTNVFQASSVYLFTAERPTVDESEISPTRTLKSNASNLPTVLHTLYNEIPARFQSYINAVQDIFREIKTITFSSTDNNGTRVLLWSIDPTTERDDLAVPLSQCGTGISQVMAMLYVVITSDIPRVIIIDEPQSFLHPGAIRKLFNIFRQHPVKHQYIITTHSPVVIAAADPDNILMVRKEGSESVVKAIDKSEKQQMEQVLRDVGASLSDVFGADDILWVEGPTEAKCYPLILEHLSKRPSLTGTVFHSIVNTGDLLTKSNNRHDLAIGVYSQLTSGVALVPPAFGFIFDRENLTDEKIDDLKRRAKGSVGKDCMAFIPRMMYENYILHPEAIAHVLSEYSGKTISPDSVQNWLDNNLRSDDGTKYFSEGPSGENSLETVHGAKVLRDLFNDLSEATCSYDKVIHGEQLTLWLLDHAPEELKEISDFLDNTIAQWSNHAERDGGSLPNDVSSS